MQRCCIEIISQADALADSNPVNVQWGSMGPFDACEADLSVSCTPHGHATMNSERVGMLLHMCTAAEQQDWTRARMSFVEVEPRAWTKAID